jgi:hypothetical protein
MACAVHKALLISGLMVRGIAASVLIVCTANVHGQTNPWLDFALNMFALQIMFTAASVQECDHRNLPSNGILKLEYEKVRAANLDFFLKLEGTKEFDDLVVKHRTEMSAESPKEIERFCAEMPAFLSDLAEKMAKLRQLQK